MTNRALDAAIAAVAHRQAGAFSWAQAEAQGATDQHRRRRLGSGAWLRPETGAVGVYLLPGIPRTWWQDVWVGHLALGPGSVLSHESAATKRRWFSFPETTPTFIVHHGAHPRVRGVIVHAIDDLAWDPSWTTELDGLAVTSPVRTAMDLAAVSSKQRLLYIVQNILPPDGDTYDELARLLQTVARRGKPGVAKMAWALQQRAGKVPAVNELQAMLHDVLHLAGIYDFIPEVMFPGVPSRRRCDVGIPRANLIIEADGRTWHERIPQIQNDRERDSEAHAEGQLVERVMWEHLKGDPEGTAARIRRIYDVRIRQLAA